MMGMDAGPLWEGRRRLVSAGDVGRRRRVAVVVVGWSRRRLRWRWWRGRGGRWSIVVVVAGDAVGGERHLRTADGEGSSSAVAGRRGRGCRGAVVGSAVADSDSVLGPGDPVPDPPLLAHC